MPQIAVRVALIVLAATISLGAQTKPAEPVTLNAIFLRHWNEIGGKVVAMAENFPDNKFDYKPVDGVRTFGDVVRHIGFWNEYVEKTARGEKADDRQNEWPKTQFRTKAELVGALKRSTEAAAAQLKAGPEPAGRAADLWVAFISHSSEHYGQLVVYYRLNGLVPPASRTQ